MKIHPIFTVKNHGETSHISSQHTGCLIVAILIKWFHNQLLEQVGSQKLGTF